MNLNSIADEMVDRGWDGAADAIAAIPNRNRISVVDVEYINAGRFFRVKERSIQIVALDDRNVRWSSGVVPANERGWTCALTALGRFMEMVAR